MNKDSKIAKALRHAFAKGYRVVDGVVIAPSGDALALHRGSASSGMYPRFTVNFSGQSMPVEIHKLVAYQKFGEALFKPGVQIRHLDGNNRNNAEDNIALGSASDNAMDQPAEVRQARAKHASAKLSRKDWDAIDADRTLGCSYSKLSDIYGVSKGTLSYRYSKVGVRRRLQNRVALQA